MNTATSNENRKSLIQSGFELDKRVNGALIVAGLGIAAVGSVIAAPAVAVFGAATVGGSVAGIAVTERLRDGYESMQAQRQTKRLGKNAFRLAA